MSENTVAKYVRQLEEKGLIYTEPTIMQSKDGKPLNGNLLYTIRPIPGVLEAFYERQFQQIEEDVARQRAAELLTKTASQSRQNTLCAPFREEASPSPGQGVKPDLSRFQRDLRGQQGSRRSPAKRVRWEKEAQRNERFSALLGGNEGYGACDDAKQDKGLASQAPPQPPLLPAVRAVSGA